MSTSLLMLSKMLHVHPSHTHTHAHIKVLVLRVHDIKTDSILHWDNQPYRLIICMPIWSFSPILTGFLKSFLVFTSSSYLAPKRICCLCCFVSQINEQISCVSLAKLLNVALRSGDTDPDKWPKNVPVKCGPCGVSCYKIARLLWVV